jgi:hypothetical protein
MAIHTTYFMKLTQDQVDRYVGSPVHCLFCDSDQIEGVGCEIDDGVCTQEINCLKCGEGWTDVYRLVGLSVYDGEVTHYRKEEK